MSVACGDLPIAAATEPTDPGGSISVPAPRDASAPEWDMRSVWLFTLLCNR